MPSVSKDGLISVTLCTSEGMLTVFLDENGEEVQGPNGSGEQGDKNVAGEHCIFASLLAFAIPAAEVAFEPAHSDAAPGFGSSGFVLLNRASVRPVGARAPPVFA